MNTALVQPIDEGSIVSTPGFEAAGVACGLKSSGALDLAMVHSTHPCTSAALFTTNLFKAAPVLHDREVIQRNPRGLRAVVINAGCANACTGEQGLRDARDTAVAAASSLGVAADDVLVMSTGVIGMPMPMAKVLAGVRQAASQLSSCSEAGHAAARAIMTTDTRPKEVAVKVVSAEGSYVIAGMAKGSGMIHPNMATMLCLLVTDARISPQFAQTALKEVVDRTLNMVSVDGDTSTNDTTLLLANGLADMPLIESAASRSGFVEGLTRVALELAKDIARDGEGATHFIEITVRGAKTQAEAKQVGMSVARSPLVKTAIYGQDANWGRIVCAVGYSGVTFDPERVGVWLNDLELVRGGAPYDTDERRASGILTQKEIAIMVDLGQGDAQATVWTCDLSHDYVSINAHYRT